MDKVHHCSPLQSDSILEGRLFDWSQVYQEQCEMELIKRDLYSTSDTSFLGMLCTGMKKTTWHTVFGGHAHQVAFCFGCCTL
jgi:hypothetical protein